MAIFKIIFNGEEQDEEFSTYEEAEDCAHDLVGAYHEGGETMELSNPGDYPYNPDDDPDYEIIEK